MWQFLTIWSHFLSPRTHQRNLKHRNATNVPVAHLQSSSLIILIDNLPSVHVGQHPCFVAGPRADCGHRTVVGQLCFWHTRFPFCNENIYIVRGNWTCLVCQCKNQSLEVIMAKKDLCYCMLCYCCLTRLWCCYCRVMYNGEWIKFNLIKTKLKEDSSGGDEILFCENDKIAALPLYVIIYSSEKISKRLTEGDIK